MQSLRKWNRFYLAVVSSVLVVLCCIILVALQSWTQDIADFTRQNMRTEILNATHDNLKRRIEHVFLHLDREQFHLKRDLRTFIWLVVHLLPQGDGDQLFHYLEQKTPTFSNTMHGHFVSVILHDRKKNEMTLFERGSIEDISGTFTEKSLQSFLDACPVKTSVTFKNAVVYLYVEEKSIHQGVKQSAYHQVHASLYGKNGYIWVNEILSFAGGDKYAVRVIHPNLKESEGILLSTDFQDAMGNLPYLTELEGINRDGEVFHTYYFKNRSDDRVVEKAAYARLYKPFNWVIATGEPLEDILLGAEEMAAYNDDLLQKTQFNVILGFLAVFAAAIAALVLANCIYNRKILHHVHAETQLDALTSALSRKAGELRLKNAFKPQSESGPVALVLLMDIDNFKQINDTYGHDMGDTVLREVTRAVKDNIRSSDGFVRWGGEEFLLLLDGIPEQKCSIIAENILECVRKLRFEYGLTDFGVTVSIGSSRFLQADRDYSQVVKRADEALYHSKRTGKDKHTSWSKLT